MTARGCVAAGHPLTAEAGAGVLREGGNAVDAAVAAALTSFVCESPLTGLGAGGFMLIHAPGTTEDVLLDFFVASPGRSGRERGAELLPVTVLFDGTPQVFNIGAASCGVPGTPAGLWEALGSHGTMPMAELAGPAAALARDGVVVNREQAYLLVLLEGVLKQYEEARAIYAPEGGLLAEGDVFRFPELGDALERFGEEGPEPFYRGEVARTVADWVCERGGTLDPEDLEGYRAIPRDPVRGFFRGREILSNPPPSAGGILVALSLDLLERAGAAGVEQVVAAMEVAQAARTERFHVGLYEEGFAEDFLDEGRVTAAAERMAAWLSAPSPPAEGSGDPADRLGSTTHISAVDADGGCASVTCSNGTGSGIIVPGTGVHVNNMLGEEDLNPLGFHRTPAGRRMPSMMAPTVVLRDGALEMALGSGGSNRIRSAILQAILRLVVDGLDADEAVRAPRVHFEAGTVQAEPGVDERALASLEDRGLEVARWTRLNWFFGGVHAVTRDPESGELRGGGDPRRGGAVAIA
jgi:gamma-glutamyltranspeptidase / glutathione hydrolase